ncbi:hypothetical protein CLV62_12448 [Dysgonomonas alginatilytica]|uniref:Uncharacterized protein n=1 Tax=Dysgonomonas alginatilytica TaxID=1605892 RepID=A0A2V3PM80_9BACT|nr:hypothetical protein [Dysgonomonas alginatilytica]PXV61893.1 hypothetical protein CLV62_12448 [Dysgonomonas alginatilytica]
MKKLILLILLTAFTVNLPAQHGRDRGDVYKNISTDIFGDLQYRNKDFKASLKKNIFDDVIYSDSKKNESKYSKEQWAELLEKFDGDREDCFIWLIRTHRGDENKKTEHQVNIFGDKITKDNSGNSETYKRNIFGDLVYENSNRQQAKLRKNIFDEMEYSDSKGTTRKYKTNEWEKLLEKYHDEEAIFRILVRKYLLSDL